MKVRRKSLWRSKNNKGARKFANMRAAKERKRLARVALPDALPDLSHVPTGRGKRTGFIVTIKCREDGESVSFVSARGPFGLTVSATGCAKKVFGVIKYYYPAK